MKELLLTLFNRYEEILSTANHTEMHEHLLWMISYSKENIELLPDDKLNRWLGFIQGVMFSNNLINIDEERDFSRPLFHEYYIKNNILIPDKASREK